MISVDRLARAYGGFVAVEGASFRIAPGEIVGLLGHNGAGKTTIMKMLSGYLEPSAGRIEIDGLDLAAERRAAQRRIGYLPENLPVYPDMDVADYLHYAATLRGLEGDALAAAVRRSLRDTDLQGRLLDGIATLSRGYRQRVGVAQAMLGAPKVLILDEPTNGLDPNQTQHMRDLIRALAANATIILSTHIMQEVDAICDRVLILRDGRLALDESMANLRAASGLRVKTNLSLSALREALPPDLQDVQAAGDAPDGPNGPAGKAAGAYRVRLSLPESESGSDGAAPTQSPRHDALAQAAAKVAAAVAGAGGELYHLAPETRDLETVFREVSTAGGGAHAA